MTFAIGSNSKMYTAHSLDFGASVSSGNTSSIKTGSFARKWVPDLSIYPPEHSVYMVVSNEVITLLGIVLNCATPAVISVSPRCVA